MVQEGLQVDAGITGVLENKQLRRKGEGMSIDPSVVPSYKSPGLLKLMQQNERRLSEKLKSKKEKSSLKKLKRTEKEAKLEKDKEKRNKFRDLQVMFDNMSKKSMKSGHEITPKKRLEYGGRSLNLTENNDLSNLKVKNTSSLNPIIPSTRVKKVDSECDFEDLSTIQDPKMTRNIEK